MGFARCSRTRMSAFFLACFSTNLSSSATNCSDCSSCVRYRLTAAALVGLEGALRLILEMRLLESNRGAVTSLVGSVLRGDFQPSIMACLAGFILKVPGNSCALECGCRSRG